MSRIANKPVTLPKGVKFKIENQLATITGQKGELSWSAPEYIVLEESDSQIKVKTTKEDKPSIAMAGTARALVSNMVHGVSEGFEKKLELVGVGYRAQSKGKVLNLALGFSHPVDFPVPEGITIETPSQTEILVKGVDKQAVGQVAAKIRAFRPPEPYKGKGVRYADEQIIRKEAKKK